MNLSTFRADFPEFTSTTDYPDALLTFWSGIAEKRVIQTRWDDLYTHGVELATAHYVALAKQNQAAPGAASGLVASESAGGVSVSYDTSAGSLKDGGHWNQTTYGRQFMELARMVGMGGYQL
jgi:hypothetical protein